MDHGFQLCQVCVFCDDGHLGHCHTVANHGPVVCRVCALGRCREGENEKICTFGHTGTGRCLSVWKLVVLLLVGPVGHLCRFCVVGHEVSGYWKWFIIVVVIIDII